MLGGRSGFLVVAHRSFNSEPLALFAGRREALRYARSVRVSPGSDAPPKGRGCLGPPGVLSRLHFLTVVEFRMGLPVPPKVRRRRAKKCPQ